MKDCTHRKVPKFPREVSRGPQYSNIAPNYELVVLPSAIKPDQRIKQMRRCRDGGATKRTCVSVLYARDTWRNTERKQPTKRFVSLEG